MHFRKMATENMLWSNSRSCISAPHILAFLALFTEKTSRSKHSPPCKNIYPKHKVRVEGAVQKNIRQRNFWRNDCIPQILAGTRNTAGVSGKITAATPMFSKTATETYRNNHFWFVVWNMNFMTFNILGIIILTEFHIFQRGWNHQPDLLLVVCGFSMFLFIGFYWAIWRRSKDGMRATMCREKHCSVHEHWNRKDFDCCQGFARGSVWVMFEFVTSWGKLTKLLTRGHDFHMIYFFQWTIIYQLMIHGGLVFSPYDIYLNMFAATPRFARGQSRISFDMLKSLRRV